VTAPRVVIIGAGQGGFQAALSLRQERFVGAITLIGDEPGLPYQRPPLSKAFLKDGNVERLALRPTAFYAQHNIELLAATRAEFIDRAAQSVLTNRGQIGYDLLILATGTRAFIPPISGTDAGNVYVLRTLGDAKRLHAALAHAHHAIVIGGGFIGLEFASAVRSLGMAASVIETAPRLMARVLSPAMADKFEVFHREQGVDLRLGTQVAELTKSPNGSTTGVLLTNGQHIAGDLVLLATGVRPNAELAATADIEVDNGIVVDQFLQTADENIFALGDCAAFPLSNTRHRVRLESVQAATDHARLIARRITSGVARPYDALPWFWSDQGDRKLQIAGLAAPDDDQHAVKSGSAGYAVLRFRGNALVCVETVDLPGLHMKARKLMRASETSVTRAALAEVNFDLSRLGEVQPA
jgi:3-phenylpropionate/trans-cinnamate dioxygenase ferredoxin reductase component